MSTEKSLGERSSGGDERRRKAPRPSRFREFARSEFAAALPGILQCFTKEAMKGSIPHAKALMAIAGMDKEGPAQVKTRVRQGVGSRTGGGARTLSELLLLELRRGSGVACEEKRLEPAKDSK